MELNDYQKTAVLDEHNACLVRANVGSGKTTVLIEKIRYLHQQKKIPLENMIVLTFTNKAAGEIKNRLKIQNIEENPSSLFYGTFHGIALKLLQEVLPLEELGYTKDFQVCLPEEELELANQLIHQHTLRSNIKTVFEKDWIINTGQPHPDSPIPGRFSETGNSPYRRKTETEQNELRRPVAVCHETSERSSTATFAAEMDHH